MNIKFINCELFVFRARTWKTYFQLKKGLRFFGPSFSKGTISVNATARQLNLSKGLVSKYFDILARAGILERRKNRFVVNDSPLAKGVRIILNIEGLPLRIFKKYPFVRQAGCSPARTRRKSVLVIPRTASVLFGVPACLTGSAGVLYDAPYSSHQHPYSSRHLLA